MKKTILKSICAFILVLSTVLSLGVISFAQDKVVTVVVDGKMLEFDVNPVIYEGRTLVPMRLIFESLGAEVTWIDATKTAVGIKGDIKIEISINDKKLLKNGEAIELDVPAQLVNSRTLVPVRAISESFGCEVGWDGELYKVTITSNKEAANEFTASEYDEFKKMYNELRYGFEQKILPQLVFENTDYVSDYIKNKGEKDTSFVDLCWNFTFAVAADMANGNDTEIKTLKDSVVLIKKYSEAVKSCGFASEDNYIVSFEVTPSGNDVILIKFKEASSKDAISIQCKYIGITAKDGVRYFTAETSPFLKAEETMLCEITKGGRNNYGAVGVDKESFLKGIDKQLG